MTEADTRRKYVLPKLLAAGWEGLHPHRLGWVEQEGAEEAEILCAIRGERADRLRREAKDFFEKFRPGARAVLNDLLDKYTTHGATQFQFPDVLQIPPISERGSIIEITAALAGRSGCAALLTNCKPCCMRLDARATQ